METFSRLKESLRSGILYYRGFVIKIDLGVFQTISPVVPLNVLFMIDRFTEKVLIFLQQLMEDWFIFASPGSFSPKDPKIVND